MPSTGRGWSGIRQLLAVTGRSWRDFWQGLSQPRRFVSFVIKHDDHSRPIDFFDVECFTTLWVLLSHDLEEIPRLAKSGKCWL
jgi:hypothetical protein